MFTNSTQQSYWTFSLEADLSQLRKEANRKFIEKHEQMLSAEEQRSAAAFFLSESEERSLTRHYEYIMREFCNRFQPPMPKYVLGTALAYFKRFYLHDSVMDYNPRDIMLTSVYLASKVEEFNVSIGQFVANLKRDREKYSDTVLGFELLLMEKLHYHLTVHNPFRPIEGLLIDMKTRCELVENSEVFRKGAEEFVEKSLLTDVCLLASPSQIALAAVLHSASREGVHIDIYVTDTLLSGASKEQLSKTVQQVKLIRFMVNSHEPSPRELARQIEKKLERCRNQENNPESELYKQKLKEMFEEEEESRTQKQARYAEESTKIKKDLLGY